MLVALYARNSIDEDVSPIEVQLIKCEAWAHKNGYTIIGKFLDETIVNQSVFERPGISRLINTVVDNNIFLIVMEHASVISEDQQLLDDFYTKMDFLDVTLETLVTHSFTPLADQNNVNKRQLKLKRYADKKRTHIISDAMKGKLPGGKIFGYETGHNGIRKPNLIEAETIRYVFENYRERQSIKLLCDDLNKHSIPAPRGEGWSKSTLSGTKERQSGMLRQTLYKGIFTFNKIAFKTNPETGKRFQVARPEKEWDRVPIPELAIVDDELFDDVQNLVNNINRKSLRFFKTSVAERKIIQKEESKKVKKKGSRKSYIVGNNLYCGICKEPLKTTRAGKYSCPNSGCKNIQLIREDIVKEILQNLSEISQDTLKMGIERLQVISQKLALERQELIIRHSEIMVVIRQSETLINRDRLQEEYDQLRVRLREIDIAAKDLYVEAYSPKQLSTLYAKFTDIIQTCKSDSENYKIASILKGCIEKVEVAKVLKKYHLQIVISYEGILKHLLTASEDN